MPAPKRPIARTLALPSVSVEDLRLIAALLFFALLLLAVIRPAAAESSPDSGISDGAIAGPAANLAETSATLQRMLSSGTLNTRDSGRTWHMLALVLESQSRFAESRRAFENAIRAFSSNPDDLGNYAKALEDFGEFYAVTGQFELSAMLRTNALHIYERLQDHAGTAKVYISLAGIALAQRHLHDGKRYMRQAEREMRLTTNLADDDRAAIFSMGGFLARLSGDHSESIAKQGRALDLWKKVHGEESALTGLGYVLLGTAYSHAGKLPEALENTQRGVAILERTANPSNPLRLGADLAYAQVLDASGQHERSAQIRMAAERQRKNRENEECVQCSVSAVAFRVPAAPRQ